MKNLLVILILMFAFTGLANDSEMGTYENLPGVIKDSTVNNIMCGDKLEIKDHMIRLGSIIRSMREMVNDLVQGNNSDEVRAVLMVDSQVLRTHLTAVLPKTPEKIKNIDPKKIQQNKIIFQRYLVKMVSYTIDMEDELLKRPMNPSQGQDQRLRLANLIIKIDDTVTEAHDLFRD
jgi:hypothetical protein